MTQSLLPLLGAAAGAMVQVLIIATVGYVCAKRPKGEPLLTPDALKVISRVANDVFLPCLSAAVLGARINVANLKGDWVLLPAGVAATALGYAVAATPAGSRTQSPFKFATLIRAPSTAALRHGRNTSFATRLITFRASGVNKGAGSFGRFAQT